MVTPHNWMPIFEWYMATPVVKNTNQKSKCYNKIGLCAQKIMKQCKSVSEHGWEDLYM